MGRPAARRPGGSRLRRARHLVGRFFGSLWPFGPRAAEVARVRTVLRDEEWAPWTRMRRADRRESVRVARRLERALAGGEHADDDRWIAAALLHDVGKTSSGLGTYGRAVATVAGAVGGPGMPELWSERRGFTRRVGLYLRHDELGAQLLRVAGARDEAASWAEAHHHPERWAALAIPAPVVAALAAADGEPVEVRRAARSD